MITKIRSTLFGKKYDFIVNYSKEIKVYFIELPEELEQRFHVRLITGKTVSEISEVIKNISGKGNKKC